MPKSNVSTPPILISILIILLLQTLFHIFGGDKIINLMPYAAIRLSIYGILTFLCSMMVFTPKDPARGQVRRRFFYPFSTATHSIQITMTLSNQDFETLTPDDIEIEYGPGELTERIDTWRDVYGIGERFKALCLNEGEGKSWYQAIVDELKWKLEGDESARTPAQNLHILRRNFENSPFADCNFIKKLFLEACERAGFFR